MAQYEPPEAFLKYHKKTTNSAWLLIIPTSDLDYLLNGDTGILLRRFAAKQIRTTFAYGIY
jgi:hypothetical protein